MSKHKQTFYIDEFGLPVDAIDPSLTASIKSKCPVKIGDRFYRKNSCVENGACLKDYLKVIDIRPSKEGYAIRARYENHAIGPFERTFSDSIFRSDDWEIVKN